MGFSSFENAVSRAGDGRTPVKSKPVTSGRGGRDAQVRPPRPALSLRLETRGCSQPSPNGLPRGRCGRTEELQATTACSPVTSRANAEGPAAAHGPRAAHRLDLPASGQSDGPLRNSDAPHG